MSACVQEPEVADSSLQSGPVEDISLVASFTGSTPIPLGNHIITIFIIYQQPCWDKPKRQNFSGNKIH